MFPSSAVSNRRPFANPTLLGIIARMGASDFPTPPAPSSLVRLVRNCALTARAGVGISMVTTYSLCKARHGLGSRGVSFHSPKREGSIACWDSEPIGLLTKNEDFGTQ